MKRINLNKDVRPLSEFRAKAASLVKQVHDTRRPLVITHRGRSAAVLLDVDEYENLIDRIETLQEINHRIDQHLLTTCTAVIRNRTGA